MENALFTPSAEAPVEKPWGYYVVLHRGKGFTTKLLCCLPGKRLSYQSHKRRCEHWVVSSGTAVVTLDGDTQRYATGDHIFIPIGSKHRLACDAGDPPVLIVETWVGDSNEEDIERFDDDFGRADSAPATT